MAAVSTRSYLLPHGGSCVTLALLTNVTNSAQLKSKVSSGLIQAALLNPKLLCSEFHVLAAVNKAVMKRQHKQMRTKTVYSEMIYSLSPSTNISESFKNFGIRDDSSSVLVVVLCPDKDDPLVESAVGAVEGELVPLDNLISLTNENAVKKVYKVSDEESAVSSLENSVVTRIATKDIM